MPEIQAINLEIKSIELDDERLNALVCVRDEEAQILLAHSRPLDGSPVGSALAIATGQTNVESSSRSDDVKNSSRRGILTVAEAHLKSKASSNSCRRENGSNQTDDSSEQTAAALCNDKLGRQWNGTSVTSIVLLGAYLDKAKQMLNQIISTKEFNRNERIEFTINQVQDNNNKTKLCLIADRSMDGHFSSSSRENELEIDSSSLIIDRSNKNKNEMSIIQLGQEDDARIIDWQSEIKLNSVQTTNHSSNTMNIIESLTKQRKELREMDKQLSSLIAVHMRSIGANYWLDGIDSISSVVQLEEDKNELPIVDEISKVDYKFDEVIDLTMSKPEKSDQYRLQHDEYQGSSLSLGEMSSRSSEQQLENGRRDQQIGAKNNKGGRFSSINLRKSRLLNAAIEMQQTIASDGNTNQSELIINRPRCDTNQLPQKEPKQSTTTTTNQHIQLRKDQSSRVFIGQGATSYETSKRSGHKRALVPELMVPSARNDLTHDMQQLKRLKPSGQSSSPSSSSSSSSSSSPSSSSSSSISSSGFHECSSSPTTCNTIQTENNVDLLRDFMLHNQYLPSYLVLECLSQCQKQTSSYPNSSQLRLLPPTMSLIDASPSSSSTARNQTEHQSGLIDCQQINQLDIAQRGGANFSEFNYYAQQQNIGTNTSINGATAAASDCNNRSDNHSPEQARAAFMLATSHLGYHSHHNQTSRPTNAAPDDNHLMISPMTTDNRHQKQQQQQQQQASQETLELIRATMGTSHNLITMADIQRVAFKCHVCGSGFEDRHRLQQHLSIHLNLQASWFDERTITETMAQYESKRGDYLCTICEIRFETTAEFDKHMQAHGDKPHRCDLCGQDNKLVSFRYYRQLLTHLRSHCFLYSCRFSPDCKQTSNRKDYLKLHILKHHLNNQLPKQYTICCH